MSDAKKCDFCGHCQESMTSLSVMKNIFFVHVPSPIYVMDVCDNCRHTLGFAPDESAEALIARTFRELIALKKSPTSEEREAELRYTLQSLYDNQNGPPLTQKRFAHPWYDAMIQASKLLGNSNSVEMYTAQKRDHVD